MKVRVIDKPCLFAETVYLLYYYINGIAYTRDYERVNRKFGRYLLEKEDQGLQLAQEKEFADFIFENYQGDMSNYVRIPTREDVHELVHACMQSGPVLFTGAWAFPSQKRRVIQSDQGK